MNTFNEQKPNFQGSLASGARGKQRPVNNDKVEENTNDSEDNKESE